MSVTISERLSVELFEITTCADLDDWIRRVEREVGGVKWDSLGGRKNNAQPVEVATDAALALVKRPTNCIDAMLELEAERRNATADTPRQAAQDWFDIPAGGLSDMPDAKRSQLAENIKVTMLDSDDQARPTIAIDDAGIGQHPDDFIKTLLSLDGENKLAKRHLMGVYNAGGSASYRFAQRAVIVSQRAPDLLREGRGNEVGVSVVKYIEPPNEKVGRYVVLKAKDGSIFRLGVSLPDRPHGTHVRLIGYEMPSYAGRVNLPTGSLWQLFHAALPEPALPIKIAEGRTERFKDAEKCTRVVNGLLHQLRSKGVSEYSDTRDIELPGNIGSVRLHYFVLKPKIDEEGREKGEYYYTHAEQGLTICLNGQRQIVKGRRWLKDQLDLFFLFKRLIVVVDGTGVSKEARRQVFSSAREAGVNSPTSQLIFDTILQELREDDQLYALEEKAKERMRQGATKRTSEKVKKQLSAQISMTLKGVGEGKKGGKRRKKRRGGGGGGGGGGGPRDLEDMAMLEIPDCLTILNTPLRIEQGSTSPLRLAINAKNGFIPTHTEGLKVVFPPEIAEQLSVKSVGRLNGGQVRLTIKATEAAPTGEYEVKVLLVVPELGVALTDVSQVVVTQESEDDDESNTTGGDIDIEIHWMDRSKLETLGWSTDTVGECLISHDNPQALDEITKVEWYLNKAFKALDQLTAQKKMTEEAFKSFQDRYEYPVCYALFEQALAKNIKVRNEDGTESALDIPDQYLQDEAARTARSILLALQPDLALAQAADTSLEAVATLV